MPGENSHRSPVGWSERGQTTWLQTTTSPRDSRTPHPTLDLATTGRNVLGTMSDARLRRLNKEIKGSFEAARWKARWERLIKARR